MRATKIGMMSSLDQGFGSLIGRLMDRSGQNISFLNKKRATNVDRCKSFRSATFSETLTSTAVLSPLVTILR
jgi:hypothetical protein